MNINLQKEMLVDLPKGFTARGATLDDTGPALELFNRWSHSIIGRDELTDLQALRNEWKSPGFDPAEDIRVILTPDGQLAGYIEVWMTMKPPVHPWIWGRVDPEYQSMGIGSWLMQWAEQHAARALEEAPEDLRVAPRVGTFREANEARDLYERLGYRYIRSSYHMLIEMDAPVPAPEFPEGITLRTFNTETDAEAVYRADADAFRDHFGFVDVPFEVGFPRFKHFTIEAEDFDPSLWFLAMDGDQIAGFSLCRSHSYDDPNLGWVGELGVRRSSRKQGLGLALLRHSFNEFYRRGYRKVGLGVDAQNLTGALRLYERAGMHVQQAFDQYEKELRPGREISVQSLSE